ncbi:uncharacterized protein [Choristoneura fumiferana]|uniref:uncharacterized protein n=1 Tax=Choristoneura fumiferana TaxID=7141 RepID=UPI003D15E764
MLLLFYAVLRIISLTLGEKQEVQRFLSDDNFKPPIFGSYSYDPIQQIFEPPVHHPAAASNENRNKLVNKDVSTKFEKDTTTSAAENTTTLLPPYRKYVKQVSQPSYLPGIKPNETAHLRYRPKIRTITFANLTLENT